MYELAYYDRAGLPITIHEYMALCWTDYATVRRTRIGSLQISTVWLGMDHGLAPPPAAPLIFEMMIFWQPQGRASGRCSWSDLWCERYATEQAALRGHDIACRMVRSGFRGQAERSGVGVWRGRTMP